MKKTNWQGSAAAAAESHLKADMTKLNNPSIADNKILITRAPGVVCVMTSQMETNQIKQSACVSSFSLLFVFSTVLFFYYYFSRKMLTRCKRRREIKGIQNTFFIFHLVTSISWVLLRCCCWWEMSRVPQKKKRNKCGLGFWFSLFEGCTAFATTQDDTAQQSRGLVS